MLEDPPIVSCAIPEQMVLGYRRKHAEAWAGELAQLLRALPTLPEDKALNPRTEVAALNHMWLQHQGMEYPLLASAGTAQTWCTDIHASKTFIHTCTHTHLPAYIYI